jgi:hypothetical protein
MKLPALLSRLRMFLRKQAAGHRFDCQRLAEGRVRDRLVLKAEARRKDNSAADDTTYRS